MFVRLVWFFKLLFYSHVCKEFTSWEKHMIICTRSAVGEEIVAGHKTVRFVRTWQERKCKDCGWVYQQLLEYGAPIKEQAPEEKKDDPQRSAGQAGGSGGDCP